MNILFSGSHKGLSGTIADWMKEKHGHCVNNLSLYGNFWKQYDFREIDTVVHVAGVTPDKASSPSEYYEINRDVTREFAIKAKNGGVRHFVFFSSMAVYGIEQSIDIEKGTVQKDTVPKPSSDYGKSKYEAELILENLRDKDFNVSIVRIPSIYGKGKTEYLDQYKYLSEKLPVIPIVYSKCYKSAICVDNLCELVSLIVQNRDNGIICPDDGEYAAVDYCSAIYPEKRRSFLIGKLMETALGKNERIRDYYGCICYSKELTNVFDCKYRVVPFQEAVKKAYA